MQAQAGGCYVPLDPDYPDDRLVCYMEDSKAAVLVTQHAHNTRAQQLGGADADWKVGRQCRAGMEEFCARRTLKS